MEFAIGSNNPASLCISRMKMTHDVDFPSLHIQLSCRELSTIHQKMTPRLSTSTRISGRSRPYTEVQCQIKYLNKYRQVHISFILSITPEFNDAISYCISLHLDQRLNSMAWWLGSNYLV